MRMGNVRRLFVRQDMAAWHGVEGARQQQQVTGCVPGLACSNSGKCTGCHYSSITGTCSWHRHKPRINQPPH